MVYRLRNMKVFLSWSGGKSRAVAEALRDWLPLVINEVEPFVSGKDIAAGVRWQVEISGELESSNFGVVCVTAENQSAPWLNFEAGALAKAVGASRVVPLVIDLKVSDVRQPLGQFQALSIREEGVLELLKSINEHCSRTLPGERLAEAYSVWWPRLEARLEAAHSVPSRDAPSRAERDLLEEILTTVRGLNREIPAQGPVAVVVPASAVRNPRLVRALEEIERVLPGADVKLVNPVHRQALVITPREPLQVKEEEALVELLAGGELLGLDIQIGQLEVD